MAIYTLGIDASSTASKCIMLKNGKKIVSKSLANVGTGTSGPQRAIEGVLKNAGKTREDMDYTLTTGYGHNSLEGIADKQMNRLSCHAKGAFFLFPRVHTVIGIDGQDVKVLKIENGVMIDFQMNDKCVTGAGRFLDVMTRVLEVNVRDLEKLSTESTKRIDISSTCTVFTENEVISQLTQGADKRGIIAGIHRAITGRVTGLMHRVGPMPDVVTMGGVAWNHGVVKVLEEQLSCETETFPLTQYNGALDAVLFAYQGALKHAKA